MKRKTVRESIWFKRVKYGHLAPNEYLCSAVGCRGGSVYQEGNSICEVCSDIADEQGDKWMNYNYHTYVPI